MCGRYTMTLPLPDVAAALGVDELPDLPPRYNIAPGQLVPALVAGRDGQPTFRVLQWGLIPFWAGEAKIGRRLINARAETAAEKPAFRAPMRHRRCVLLADGFYEWTDTPQGRQPLWIHHADRRVMLLAGIWDVWQTPTEGPCETCCILTCRPNALVGRFHHRMPVLLAPQACRRWLDPENHRPHTLADLLQPMPADTMTCHPVSRRVNRPAADDPGCIEPVGG